MNGLKCKKTINFPKPANLELIIGFYRCQLAKFTTETSWTWTYRLVQVKVSPGPTLVEPGLFYPYELT